MDVYLDNSSTTFPKPKQVIDGIYNYMLNVEIGRASCRERV